MNKRNRFLTLMGFVGLLFVSSCSKDDEVNPTDPTDDRAKFRGTWAVAEKSKEFGASTYNVTITDSTTSSHLLIAYLYSFKRKTVASVNDNNLFIPAQVIDGVNVAGSGVLENPKRISLKYTVQMTKTKFDTVTAILTK